MFQDADYPVVMDEWMWLPWLLVILVLLFYGWRHAGWWRDNPHESPHDALRKRLLNREISPQLYRELNDQLDRDADLTG